ncbi:predicted protein [Aspergillus terreus NIH2624]|uniref:Mid2 domain-containing protein n=1 Tax=Aspergillus terreus (strain NIH 2624 / FGSC A1156) TaxID=341663 RepID=Q0CX40_ASPTN|nr:uncharacterized protein ATEG_01744 [Aspergillus terreus NIH2624]EAU38501.1 predicted protein [Aspergillus terreus NIH2624]
MRRLHTLYALYALSLLPTTSAWTFVWHNAQNNSFVESGSSNYPCTQVANPEGMAFEYDSEEDPTTIYLYGNTNCAGTPGGQADHYLAKAAGNFIGSFRIVDRTKSTTATPTSTVTTATTSSTPSATTGTGSAAQTTAAGVATAEGGSALSGGAIAGVVVGVVAGVAIIAAVVFFLVRRRRKSAAAAEAGQAGLAESGAPTLIQSPAMQGYKEALKEPEHPVVTNQTQSKPPQVMELAGDSLVEMSDSHRVNELEDSSRRIHQ